MINVFLSNFRQRQNQNANIFIFVYSLDALHSVFSHQLEIVTRISPFFRHTYVLSVYAIPEEVRQRFPNIVFYSLDLGKHNKIIASVNLYRYLVFSIYRERRNLIFFGHMTDSLSALAAPLTKVLGLRHFLWYAHTSNSLYFKICLKLLTGIFTSTVGSTPMQSPKIKVLGQGIDLSLFPFSTERDYGSMTRLVSVGRLDKSKGIDELIETLIELRTKNPELTLTFFGQPTPRNKSYFEALLKKYSSLIGLGIVQFSGSLPRSLIANTLQQYDVFIHFFKGSLDKVLLEASAIGIPVITLNEEYWKFASGFSDDSYSTLTLVSQYHSLISKDPFSVADNCLRLRRGVEELHSIDNLIRQVAYTLKTE